MRFQWPWQWVVQKQHLHLNIGRRSNRLSTSVFSTTSTCPLKQEKISKKRQKIFVLCYFYKRISLQLFLKRLSYRQTVLFLMKEDNNRFFHHLLLHQAINSLTKKILLIRTGFFISGVYYTVISSILNFNTQPAPASYKYRPLLYQYSLPMGERCLFPISGRPPFTYQC